MPLGHSGAMSPYINGVRSNTADELGDISSCFGIVDILGYHCTQMPRTIPELLFPKLVKHENHQGCLLKIHVPGLLPILIE